MIRQCESGIPVNDLEPLNNVTKKHQRRRVGPTSASVINDKRDTPNVGHTNQIKR